jgi:hydrogenase/urease accessory protein HupE
MSSVRNGRRRFVGLCAVALFVAAIGARPADAHWADLAVAEITVEEGAVEMRLVFPTGLVRWADANRDGHLSAAEVHAHRARLETVLAERIRISGASQAGAKTGVLSVAPVESAAMGKNLAGKNLRVTPDTHSSLALIYRWERPIRSVQIHYGFFEPGVATSSVLTTVLQAGRVQSFVFTPENPDLVIRLGAGALLAQAKSFVVLGIEHILTGYDHILFLLSLLMIGSGFRYLVKTVSAFTIAHSITLSLAVLNIVSLPGRWVESAIALSIVYVALENFWRKERALSSRALITFGFGLLHGLGFASILQEFAIPRGDLAISLASFNVGVEVGQVAVVTLAYLMLQVIRRWPREVLVRRAVSAAAAAVGLIWFVQRALLS